MSVVDEPASVTSDERHRKDGCSGDWGEVGSCPMEGRRYLSNLGW